MFSYYFAKSDSSEFIIRDASNNPLADIPPEVLKRFRAYANNFLENIFKA